MTLMTIGYDHEIHIVLVFRFRSLICSVLVSRVLTAIFDLSAPNDVVRCSVCSVGGPG
jgi:hypothetical protein